VAFVDGQPLVEHRAAWRIHLGAKIHNTTPHRPCDVPEVEFPQPNPIFLRKLPPFSRYHFWIRSPLLEPAHLHRPIQRIAALFQDRSPKSMFRHQCQYRKSILSDHCQIYSAWTGNNRHGVVLAHPTTNVVSIDLGANWRQTVCAILNWLWRH
jgi:hypothetical protein